MVWDGKGSEKGLFGRLGSAKGANIRISRDACGDAINHYPCGLCSCTAAVGQPYTYTSNSSPKCDVETGKGNSQSEYDGKGR